MDIKAELIKRYCYIYENANYILAPYMKQYSENEKNKGFKRLNSDKIVTILEQLPHDLLIDLESFLLSDVPYDESKLYMELEVVKTDSEFLDTVDKGLDLLKKHNDSVYSPYLKLNITPWEVFSKVRQFIDGQVADRYNRVDKLHAMDEYFKIDRYTNDGRVWTSGYDLNSADAHKNYYNLCTAISKNIPYLRENDDAGLDGSNFISYLNNTSNKNEENKAILTETEKQRIYLRYHDELPWNMMRVCEFEEKEIPMMFDLRLQRPEHTSPCGEKFYIKEEEIFIDPSGKYYQLCPYCGYIVNISKNLLSKGVKERIDARCEKDINLFRKMCLYSELFALEKETPSNGKKLLKTNKR